MLAVVTTPVFILLSAPIFTIDGMDIESILTPKAPSKDFTPQAMAVAAAAGSEFKLLKEFVFCSPINGIFSTNSAWLYWYKLPEI